MNEIPVFNPFGLSMHQGMPPGCNLLGPFSLYFCSQDLTPQGYGSPRHSSAARTFDDAASFPDLGHWHQCGAHSTFPMPLRTPTMWSPLATFSSKCGMWWCPSRQRFAWGPAVGGQVGSCFWGNPLSTKFSQTLFFFLMFVASWRPWSCDLTYTDYNNLLMW